MTYKKGKLIYLIQKGRGPKMNKLLTFMLATAVVLSSVSMAGITLNLNPVDDAMVDSTSSTTNYGYEGYLSIQGISFPFTTSIQESFLMFDLSTIPDTAVVDSAILYVYAYDYESAASAALASLHYVGDDTWDEGDITWVNAPTFDAGYFDDQISINADGWYSWDLLDSSGTDSWADYSVDLQDDLISLMIKALNENSLNSAQFYSDEYSDRLLRPYLEITYTVIPAPGAICLAAIGIVFVRRLRLSH